MRGFIKGKTGNEIEKKTAIQNSVFSDLNN